MVIVVDNGHGDHRHLYTSGMKKEDDSNLSKQIEIYTWENKNKQYVEGGKKWKTAYFTCMDNIAVTLPVQRTETNRGRRWVSGLSEGHPNGHAHSLREIVIYCLPKMHFSTISTERKENEFPRKTTKEILISSHSTL